MPEEALTSFAVCNAYRYFSGNALFITSQSRSHIEYLLPTDDLIVFDSCFNLMKTCDLLAGLLHHKVGHI